NPMQKVIFEDTSLQIASGTITYTAIPTDGDTVTVDGTTFEFDTGGHASGVLTYVTSQPADGDTFTLADTVYEADNDCVVAPGHVQWLIGATVGGTFTNLRDVINTLQGSFINAVINTTAKTVTVTDLVSGS